MVVRVGVIGGRGEVIGIFLRYFSIFEAPGESKAIYSMCSQ